MRTFAPLAFALVLSGCVLNGNKYQRPRDLEQPWEVTKPRLLAVRAEPAEPRPGDTVVFEALLVDPNDEIDSTLWIACPTDDNLDIAFGCIADSEQIIGIEPFQAPVYTTPTDILDGLEGQDRLEGRYVLVQVTGLPPIDPNDPDIDFEDIDFNQVEAGYKRIVVSEATTPNQNPVLTGVLADGNAVLPGQVIEVDAGQRYDIGVTIDDRSIERYEFLNGDGQIENRIEEPYVTWYTTSGVMVEPATLYPFLEATWEAPDESGTEGTIWAVCRDRRGGQDWLEIPFRVR
ncbi:MAG: hypothetical protein H6737_27615 [Alphaproteobacteria bacterium]|nr:hypothetical protein [Alphaproteobacteria bacterium]